ncbi:Quinone oxidoreductase 2 [Marinomonas gallaica]|uniref:Quinone oxidoreductase 2 n=1 Tax=Marinomonas gallaica TaxID=1806667 RepID=A0A1C3JRQ4_9GAMM|nr:SDR family oxidoreductase [Marinomonas gallaica]SBT17805.1 Quinone oxidoreductase 2 [Marinomonas gallaica]SBT20131.1 Quinone oxidoreductase 2 [Marinomonas gallaica]
MILVTGATGQLGKLVITGLLARGIAADGIVAAVRSPDKADDLAQLGVIVRKADYTDPTSLKAAMVGVKRVVLVSSSEVGQRAPQHQNVIDAAKENAIELLAYTSILHAETSPLALAEEHRATEAALKASGVPHVLLRNGWYSENYTASAAMALEHGAVLGSAGEGQYATATRADYADAAAIVITSEDQAGKVYELAGDESFTLAEYAALLASISGKEVVYQNLPETEYAKVLVDVGLPEGLATILADSDVGAAKGGLFDDSHTLSTLIGRPTTPIQDSIKIALK